MAEMSTKNIINVARDLHFLAVWDSNASVLRSSDHHICVFGSERDGMDSSYDFSGVLSLLQWDSGIRNQDSHIQYILNLNSALQNTVNHI